MDGDLSITMNAIPFQSVRPKSRLGAVGHGRWPLLAALLAPGLLLGADYTLDRHTLDGGGGTSTNGPYSLSGTLGQPDGGAMSGGEFTLQGGFGALPVAVQTTNAPRLKIVPAGPGWATLSWAPATPGFVLQETGNLWPAQWTSSPSGAANPVSVPAVFPARFYRLFKP